MTPERKPYTGQSYKLYDDYNDIHVFVEDAGYENLYKVLFQRNGLKLENIFSKNGKASVLKAARETSDPKCVFIVDRDWCDLLGTMPSLKNVVVLAMHSIECYLINYEAFAGLVLSEKPRGDIEALLSKEHFQAIIKDVCGKLRPLFECFVTIQMADNKQKGCSHKPGHFGQKNRSCAPDKREIGNFIASCDVSPPTKVKDYFSERSLTRKGHGKFMLHFVWEAARHKSQLGRIGIDKLMIRLALLIDTPEVHALANDVRARATSS